MVAFWRHSHRSSDRGGPYRRDHPTPSRRIDGVKSNDAQFADIGEGAMKIEADTSAASVTHYSIFDRTQADIDDPDLAGDLDHLAAILDYLDYLASQRLSRRPLNIRRSLLGISV